MENQLQNLIISAQLTPKEKEVADYVLEKGYDPQYGARPLRRAIQNELEDFLADEYLEGHIKNNDKILLDIEKDKPVIQKERKKKKTE